MYLCLKVQSKQFSSGIRGSIAYSFFFQRNLSRVFRGFVTHSFFQKIFHDGGRGGSREIHGLVSCGSLTHSFFKETFRGGFADL